MTTLQCTWRTQRHATTCCYLSPLFSAHLVQCNQLTLTTLVSTTTNPSFVWGCCGSHGRNGCIRGSECRGPCDVAHITVHICALVLYVPPLLVHLAHSSTPIPVLQLPSTLSGRPSQPLLPFLSNPSLTRCSSPLCMLLQTHFHASALTS